MAEPVTGKDAVIMFMKGEEYFPYACAIDIEIAFEMETVSVKTIGDGVWAKPRGQALSYQISLNGVIKYDDDTQPHAFDLLSYLMNMVAVQYRIIFTNDEAALKVIEGTALPTNVNLGGGSEGFANGSATLKGDGAVDVRDLIIPCPSSIISIQLVEGGDYPVIRITDHTGSPMRYDYSVDGGGFVSQYVTSFIQDLALDPGISAGGHTITIIPVCQNGENGQEFTAPFTIIGVGSCDAPTDVVFSSVTETIATGSWTAPGSPPAEGYYWELLQSGTPVQTGSTMTTSVNLTGLTGGLTYTLRVKSLCDAGVSESAFASNSFTTDASADPTQLQWVFNEEGAGVFTITVNSTEVVNETSSNDGTEIVDGGDTVSLSLVGLSGNLKELFVKDLTTGVVLHNSSSMSAQFYEFTATTNHIYEIIANELSI